MFHKKVELTELFYDLVFVYAISQMTSLIHHLHDGVLSFAAFSSFLVALIVLVNTWLIQMVYTNRYGQNSLVNILFMMVGMMLVLTLSNTFGTDWTRGSQFYTFALLVIGLNAVLLLQYFWEFFQGKDSDNRKVIRFFILLLTARTVLLLLALLFPVNTAATLSLIIIVVSTLMPMLFTKTLALVPTNFPHLIERLSLLVIVTFGETLVGIAPYFQSASFSWLSVGVFLTVVSLFMFYIVEVDHLIDEKKTAVTGNALIYHHYPIILGLSMVTVSLAFFREEDVSHSFLAGFLFVGLFLFYLGVLLNNRYNKPSHTLDYRWLGGAGVLFLLGLLASLLVQVSLTNLLLVVTLTTLALTVLIVTFNLTRMPQKEADD